MNWIVRWAIASALALAAGSAAAQTNWPDKPVKLIVGFTAGSGADAAGGTCKEDGSHYAAVSKGKPHCHPCATRQLR